MRLYSTEEIQPVTELMKLIEKVVASRNLEKYHNRTEIEKIFGNLLEGRDTLNPYERRAQGVEDAQWQESIKGSLYFLGLKKMYEKIYKS